MGEVCPRVVSSGKVQFLNNWSVHGKCHVQNTKVNKLHAVACEILRRNVKPYTSHTWHCSAATNLADAGMSFINLKRHGQWISDPVVEGYVANSKPL